MTGSVTITPAAFALGAGAIKRFEGLRLEPYWDPNGCCYSIGYGMCQLPDGSPVTARTPALTAAQAVAMLETKLRAEYAPGVERACTGAALADPAWAALLDFAWNLGDPCLEQSGIGLLLARGETQAAAMRVRLYTRSRGRVLSALVTRRAVEAAMLLGTPGAGTSGTSTGAAQAQGQASLSRAAPGGRTDVRRELVPMTRAPGQQQAAPAADVGPSPPDQVRGLKASGATADELDALYNPEITLA